MSVKITAVSDAGSILYWVCGTAAAGGATPNLQFIFAAGDIAANRIGTVRWHDAVTGNVNAANVPFTAGVAHDVDLEFEGGVITVEIDGVLVLTTPANCSAAAAHVCILELNMSGSDDSVVVDDLVITS